MIDLHLHLFVEGRYESHELSAHLHAVQLILTDIERAPHIVHHGNRHDRRASTYQLAHLGIDIGNLTLFLGNLNRLVDIGVHLLYGTLGTTHLGRSSHLVLHAGTVHRHVILTLGSLHLSLHRLIVGKSLIAFLGTHHTLVEKTLHTVVGFLCDLETGFRLLQDREGTLDLLLTGTVLSLQLQGGCGILGTLCLFHLRAHLRGIQDGKRITGLHVVTLLHTEFEDTARNLT